MKRPSARERRAMTSKARKRAFKIRNHVRCHYCGKGLTRQTATGDHRNPISRGGKNKQRNIVIACTDCNSRKGSMDMGTFMRLIREDGTYQCKRRTNG
jgi:5-methylcytosine-specific restriction endonuclease McrA